jgi:carbon storage regulator
MLVLTRKKGERIVIGQSVELEVVSISGGRVKLGFVASPDVRILRKELVPRDDAPTPPSNSRPLPSVRRAALAVQG